MSSVLSSGVFFGTTASPTPSKRGFDSRTYTAVHQAAVRNAYVMARPPDHASAGWTTQRDRWETVHLIRTATALIGLVGTLAATPNSD
ncbi:hypothetical protein GCM10009539_05820 [Cryptosporangium japonicum]|uniref:Uncharacterized protein n=1 Tax=Cryptosporangium japonicum TaxID=80872 RepID=A0ABP3D639_9ACTN